MDRPPIISTQFTGRINTINIALSISRIGGNDKVAMHVHHRDLVPLLLATLAMVLAESQMVPKAGPGHVFRVF